MRVLWINHRDPLHPESGGAETRIKEIGGRLTEKRCSVTLLCESWSGSKTTDMIDGVEVLRIAGRYGVHLKTPNMVRKMQEEYDVVIDDVAHGVPWFSSVFTRKPVIGQIHHVHQEVAKMELPWHSAWFVVLGERAIKYLYETVVAVSESTKENLIGKLGVPSRNIEVILNGIDHNIYRPSKKSFCPSIVWVGRVKRYKRVEHVILAFREVKKKIPNARLSVLGDGSHLGYVKNLARRLAVPDVDFLGRVDEAEKVRLMGESWLIVGTSVVEGWGMTMIEGAACGTPSVAYDVPGFKDSIRSGETGILVEDGNIGALSAGIFRVIENEACRIELSKNALAYSKRFDWNSTTESFLKVLERAASER
jgi:glycosyltransferase involved in cell wall biosynthesis